MDVEKERRVLARMIWREQLRLKQPDMKDNEQLKANWDQEKKSYLQLANKVIKRAEKRGYKVSVTDIA